MKKQIMLLIALVMLFPCPMQAMHKAGPQKDLREKKHAAKFVATKKNKGHKMAAVKRTETVIFERKNRQQDSQHLIKSEDFVVSTPEKKS